MGKDYPIPAISSIPEGKSLSLPGKPGQLCTTRHPASTSPSLPWRILPTINHGPAYPNSRSQQKVKRGGT